MRRPPIKAFVGGGASGIGFAIAARLSTTHDVTIAGRRADALTAAAARLKEHTGRAVGTLVCDVSAPDAVAAVSAVLPDVLILNAGGPPPGRILEVDDDAWRSGAELLLLGPLRLARAALP